MMGHFKQPRHRAGGISRREYRPVVQLWIVMLAASHPDLADFFSQATEAETSMRRSQRQTRPKAPVRKDRDRAEGNAVGTVDYKALAQFRFQLRNFLSFSEAAARNAGLTPRQHQALLAIKGFSSRKPISVGDLAELLLVRHHTAVELADRITRLGLLKRIVDDGDSRRMLVKLTRKGEQKLLTLSKIHFEELQAAGPRLTRILRPFRRARPH